MAKMPYMLWMLAVSGFGAIEYVEVPKTGRWHYADDDSLAWMALVAAGDTDSAQALNDVTQTDNGG